MDCNLGSSGFFVLNPTEWYTIEVAGFPATTLLSQKSNRSFSEGRVLVKPSGLKLQEGGNYSVSFSAILQSTDPNNIVVVPVFLVSNGDFDPTSKNTIASVAVLQPGAITTVQGSGILHDIKPGTTLSLVATGTGSPNTETMSVVNWNISAFKIPCE